MLFQSLPTASSAYILARHLGGDAPLMAGIIALQTVVAALAIPLALLAAMRWLPEHSLAGSSRMPRTGYPGRMAPAWQAVCGSAAEPVLGPAKAGPRAPAGMTGPSKLAPGLPGLRSAPARSWPRGKNRLRNAECRSIATVQPAMHSVRVWRGTGEGAFRRYDVPAAPEPDLLDLVTYIQRVLDPSLAYRFACRVGMCGSCAMTVNGRPRWTCRTHVAKVAAEGELDIAPLANMPVIKDLAVDMREFFDKWARAKGAFVPSDDAAARLRRRRAGLAGAPRGGRRDRVHRLRRLLRGLRRRRAGTRTTSAPRRSTAPGRSSTMCATTASPSASSPSPATPAAMPATATRAAAPIARKRSTRPPRSPA